MKLGGVIYLHDITQARMSSKNLGMFRKICGDKFLGNVVLGTTKWDQISPADGEQRQKQLQGECWKEMIEQGSEVYACKEVTESARAVVNIILRKIQASGVYDSIQIQEELVNLDKYIPETAAGQELRFTVKQYLNTQKGTANSDDPKAAEPLKKQLQEQLKALQLPLSVCILTFLGLRR